jgi:uroporphyrin-III C-methyltransferase / precorrin-2 dehydrogenase / sirohydrochlorin ferrochelatase
MHDFPVFLNLEKTPPLVVGGGNLAVAKARLLLKRAPRVVMAANAVPRGLASLAEAGRVAIVSPNPDLSHIRGRPLVISATGNEAEDARVSAVARALGVPVNVPDRPDLCTFSLPAIVDRGEVTIAIGTSGAAPVLAQRLRAWLEQELPPRLGTLARIAREFRNRVAARLPAGPARRRFWERVIDGPAGRAALAGDEPAARRLLAGALDAAAGAPRPQGRVVLVGAGPGDPELLTLRAVRALKSADVILYDRLVGEEILDLARREATLIPVGKCKGKPGVGQAEINHMMLVHAQSGRTVVRLKGGDPFIFGRGGEEVDVVRAAGVPVEVVPGVTAATAAAASAQIPLTHRDLSRTVTFLSGHGPGDGQLDLEHVDLEALKDGRHTIAVYMGASVADRLAARLLAAGWQPRCPVLVVENASHSNEWRVRTTIADLAQAPGRLGLAGPAILFIGEVAGLPVAEPVEALDLAPIKIREAAYA